MKMKSRGRSLMAWSLICVMAAAVIGAGLRPEAIAAGDNPANPAVIRIAYLPVVGKDETVKRYAPLTSHLARKLGRTAQGVSYESYREMLLGLARGEYEVAYLSPAMYAAASSVTRLEPIAIELSPAGERGYYSIIITRSDSGLRTLEDCRGKSCAFTNQNSTSGFIAPLNYFLTELKTTPASFASSVVFAGNHENVIMGVYHKTYDFGATDNQDLAYVTRQNNLPHDSFRVLWTSEMIPGAPVCVRPDLDPALKRQILTALESFSENPEATRALFIGGYAPASNRDFEVAKRLYPASL